MKKNVIALTMALTMAAGTLSGCGGGSTGKAAADAQASKGEETTAAQEAEVDPSKYEVTEKIEIEWWHALEEQYTDTVDKVVKGFNESQDLITVKPVYVGNYAAVNEALVAAHAAGTGLPAVAVANAPFVSAYGSGGLTEDLTPYIQATDFDIEDFGEGLIEATSYEGKQVTMPFLISTQIMYYNKDMAEELGITIPEKWEDMGSFLEAASVVNGGTTERYGTIIPGWDQWYFETFFLNNGVNIVNEDRISTDLGGEAASDIVKQIKDWSQKGHTYVAVGETASSEMRQNFIDGKAFSVIHTSSLYNTYVDNCDFEVGMAWLPGGDTKVQEIGGSVLLIPAKNDQATKNAAWQFLQYMCSKDVNMIWASETGYLPTRNSVQQTEEGQKFLEEKPEFQVIFDNLDLIQPRIQHPGWDQLATIWKNYLAEIVIEDVDVDEMLEEMAVEIDEVLEDS